MNEWKEKESIFILFMKAYEGSLNAEEARALNNFIQTRDEAAGLYVEFFDILSGLVNFGEVVLSAEEEDLPDYDIWMKLLAEEEKQAPPVEQLKKAEPKQEQIPKIVYEKTAHKVRKIKLFSAILSAAALIVILVYAHFSNTRPSRGMQVATLVDQINVQWANPGLMPKNGWRLQTNEEPMELKKGIVKINYDDGVEVFVEGPAVFEIERLGIFLNYGRIYSQVSERGLGFTIKTPTSQFVDHGTEFGIKAEIDGCSELHVIKGRVQLFADSRKKYKSSQMILENQAVRYDAVSNTLQPVPFQRQAFVRQINSKTRTIWRGQERINLADIVGWGNGFGTGKPDTGIDPGTGKAMILTLSLAGRNPQASNTYRSVPSNPFIDGVFVPDSQAGRQVISSAGHTYTGFPVTGGNYYLGILNGTSQDFTGFQNYPEYGGPGLALDGLIYGTPENPSIFIHSNQGITFDLQAIRNSIPGTSIVTFESICGISQTAPNYEEYGANLYVLVDGQVQFRQEDVARGQSFPVKIMLNQNDRFLTLMSTVSAQTDLSKELPTVGDWCLFGRPVLVLDYP